MTDRALLDRLETAFSGLRKPTPQELSAAWGSVAATAAEILSYAGDTDVYPGVPRVERAARRGCRRLVRFPARRVRTDGVRSADEHAPRPNPPYPPR